MPTELEMKLRIPSVTVADRILSDKMVTDYLAGEIKTIPMVSKYYDTPTSALSNLRWSLRLRQEGTINVLSLKTSSSDISGDLFVRNEWQVICDTVEAGIPLLLEQGAPAEFPQLIGDSTLVERCRIEFTRRSTTLKLPEGVLVELAIDKGTIYAGEKSAPIRARQAPFWRP